MAIKDWNGFKKSGDTYIPNDATARAGVTATVDLLKDTTGWIGGNECVNNAVSKTENGVTWTINADKSISVYGQPTEGDAYIDVNPGAANVSANGVAFICNGCPSGGGNDKYYVQIRLSNPDGTWYGARTDTGNGYQLTTAEVTANVKIQYRCVIPSGAPAIPQSSPIVFRPMIISPEEYAISPSYRPYHESVEDWYWSENAKLGAHQIIPLTIEEFKTLNTNGTWTGNSYSYNDVTLTFEETDGYVTKITANGTPSGNVWFTLKLWVGTFKKGSYELLGCPTGGGSQTYQVLFREDPQVSGGISVNNYGNPTPFTITDTTKRYVAFVGLMSGVTFNNKVFTPLIRYAEDTNSECTPYAMTNRELTEKVQELNGYEDVVSLESGLSLWTINKVVKYGKVCTLNLSITASTAITESALIGTLPSGFRPKAIIFVPVGHPNYNGVAKLDTNGEITFTPPTGASVTNICIVTTFIL